MIEPTRGWTRALRSAVLAAAVVALAAAAHVLGGGAEPGPGRVGVLFVLTLGPCAVLTGRRLATPALVGVVALGQVGLHHALMLGTAMPAAAHPGAHHAHATAHATAHAMVDGSLALARPTGLAALLLGESTPMVLTHTVAAGLTVWVLARGERVAWELWLCLPHLSELQAVKPLGIPPRTVPAPDTSGFTAFTGVGWARVLRGPPPADVR